MDSPFDDMTLGREIAQVNGYHERSPSMMIVVPLDDSDDGVYRDEQNASFYEYSFGQDDEDDDSDEDEPAQQTQPMPKRMASPRSVLNAPRVVEEIPKMVTCFRPHSIPFVTDFIHASSTVSRERKSCHRRSRNRAFGSTDFARSVLPKLQQDLQEQEDGDNAWREHPLLQ
jgi:hypothetical protein